MIKFNSLIFSCFLLFGVGVNVKAQNNITSSGGDAAGSGGTVNYSIGQTDYITVLTGAGVITQGVQQPYEILSVGLGQPSIQLNALAYPNPVNSRLVLEVGDLDLTEMSFELSDASGKLIIRENILAGVTEIDMSYLSQGAYFIVISAKKQELKTFKILKNN